LDSRDRDKSCQRSLNIRLRDGKPAATIFTAIPRGMFHPTYSQGLISAPALGGSSARSGPQYAACNKAKQHRNQCGPREQLTEQAMKPVKKDQEIGLRWSAKSLTDFNDHVGSG